MEVRVQGSKGVTVMVSGIGL
jgi:hypothetical protein